MLEQRLDIGQHRYTRDAFTRVVQPVPTLVQGVDGVYRLEANSPKFGDLKRVGASTGFTSYATNSNTFAGTWSTDGFSTITANAGVDPFGGLTADKWARGGNIYLYRVSANDGLPAGVDTHSVFVKRDDGGPSFRMTLYGAEGSPHLASGLLNLNTGELSEQIGTENSVQELTNGWFRVSLRTVDGSTPRLVEFLIHDTVVVGQGCLLFGYNATKGPQEYLETTGWPVTLNRLDRVTNLIYPSSDLTAWWNNPSSADPQGLPVTPNAMLAPDGTMTADVTAAGHTRYKNARLVAGNIYTLSVYVRPSDPGKDVWLFADGLPVFGGYLVGVFSPAAMRMTSTIGSVGGVVAGRISDEGQGWYRMQVTLRAADSGDLNMHIYPTNDDVHGWWGAQVVEGWEAQDLIQTTSAPASVTRQPAGHVSGSMAVEGEATNLLRRSGELNLAPWFGMPAVQAAERYMGVVPFWTLSKVSSGGSEAIGQIIGPVPVGGVRTFTVALLAGTSRVCNVGINSEGDGWGGTATPGFEADFEVIEGPGRAVTSAWGNALPEIQNLSDAEPTVVRVTRNFPLGGNSAIYLYPGTPWSGTIGDSVKATRVDLRVGSDWDSYIPTTTPVTRPADQVFVRAAYPAGVDVATRRVNGFMWLVEAFFTPGVQRWTNWPMDVTWQGHVFAGLGALGGVSEVQEGESGAKGKVTLRLSPVAAGMLPLALGNVETYRGRAVNIYVWPIDSDYRRVGQPILRHFGVMDQVSIKPEGDSGSIEMTCLSGGYNGARKSQGLRVSHEQQKLAHPGDRGLEYALGLVNNPQLWLSKAFQEI